MAKKMYLLFDKIRLIMMVSISSFTIVLCFVQIVLRYFTFLSLRPFAWGDEVLRLSAIWIIFLGISYGVREKAHFTADLLVNRIASPKARHLADLAIDALVVLILAVLTYEGFRYSFTNIASSLQNVDMSMAWFYSAIPVGCAFGILEYGYKIAYGDEVRKWLFSKPGRVEPQGGNKPQN